MSYATLTVRNRLTRQPATDRGSGYAVSMTTYGRRLAQVHIALESIARGTLRPERLYLWIDAPEFSPELTSGLRRLQARGVQIRPVCPSGPHGKYIGLLSDGLDGLNAFVLGDDDVMYDRTWLASLDVAHRAHPDEVMCHRAHSVTVTEDGRLAPYADWRECWSSAPSYAHFATGVGGVLYPARVIGALRAEEDRFRDVAPWADDVWLHSIAVRAGLPTRQVSNRPAKVLTIPGSQKNGLKTVNVNVGGNDGAIARSYDQGQRRRIREAESRSSDACPDPA